MKSYNNYDLSSSGVKLDLVCAYDTKLAYVLFSENISSLNNDYYFYRHNLESCPETYLDLIDYKKMSKAQLSEYAKEALRDFLDEEEKATKAVLLNLINETKLSSGYGNISKAIMNKFSKYDVAVIHGDVQKDTSRVIFKKTKTSTEDKKKFIGYLTNLFYAAPVYCKLYIDDDEYYLDEYLENSYDYDRELILASFEKNLVHEKKEYILSWLKKNLPEYPDYD